MVPAQTYNSSMPQASLKALLDGYQGEIDWLLAQAEAFERGERKLSARIGGKERDISGNIAAEYRYKAGNMAALREVYERALVAKAS